LDEESCIDLLKASNKYSLEDLNFLCSCQLIKLKPFSISNACEIFALALENNSVKIKTEAITFIRSNLKEIFGNAGLLKLNMKYLENIISDDKLQAEEDMIFKGIIWYLKENEKTATEENATNLFLYVRFENLSQKLVSSIKDGSFDLGFVGKFAMVKESLNMLTTSPEKSRSRV